MTGAEHPPGRGLGFGTRLGLITAGALAIRVASVLTVATANPGGGDPLYYHEQANLLAGGHGFAEPFAWLGSGRVVPTALHPPLYSMVLAISSLFGGTGFFAHKLVSCLIGAAAVAMIGLLGREVGGAKVGLLAAAFAAAYPNLWVIDGILMPEGLFVLTCAVVVLAAYRLQRRSTPLTAAALGAAVGLAALTRGEAVLLLAVLVLPLIVALRGQDVRRRITLLGVAVVVALGVIAPWAIRNAVRFERPVPLSTNGEEVLAYANCDQTYSGDALGFWKFSCEDRGAPGDESQRAAYWRDQGLSYARDHLDRVPVVIAARLGRTWELFRPLQGTHFNTVEGRDIGVSRVGLALYAVAVPFAVLGAVILRRRRTSLLPLLALPVMVTVTAACAYGITRFRAPAEITIVVLAAVAVDHLYRQRSHSSKAAP